MTTATRPRVHRLPKGPSNLTSVCLGYDQPSWVTSYVETHCRGVCRKAYRPARERIIIPPNQLFHKTGDKYVKSMCQETYQGYKPETTADIYLRRKDELDKNKLLHTVDSTLLNELESINDDIHEVPKSVMKNDFMDRQNVRSRWPAVQAPRTSSIPPQISKVDDDVPQENLTESAHQYQWPRGHPSDIYRVLYKRYFIA